MRTPLRLALVFLACVSLMAATLRSQEPAASVSGHVLQFGTRAPGADVTVELIREAGATPQATPPTPPLSPILATAAAGAATNSRMTVSVGPDGAFQLRGVPPGEYRLYATAQNGYLPAEFGQLSATGLGIPFTLTAGQEAVGLTLTLTPTASITGRVTDAAGDPVVFANVMAGRVVYQDGVRRLEGAQSSMTNDRGEYRIFWLAPGSYVLTAIPLEMRQYNMPVTPPSRFGGREHLSLPLIALRSSPAGDPIEVTYMPSYFPGVADLRSSKRIVVGPGDSVRADMNVASSEVPSMRVRGTVTYGGKPAAGARLTLVPRWVEGHSVQPPAGNADSAGAFDIHGVVPGSYLLFAEWNGTSLIDDTGLVIQGFAPANSPIGGTAVIPVEVGERNVDNLRLQISPHVAIPWRATFESDDTAVPDIQVALARDPNLVGFPGTGFRGVPRGAAPRGSTVLQNVGSGDYRINVTGLPAGAYVKAIHLGGEDVLRDGLHVYGPTGNTLEIVLSRKAGTLEGQIVNAERQPFANAAITLVPPIGQRPSRVDLFKTTYSKTDGSFRIEGISPGDYRLFAWEDVQTGDWYNPDFMRDQEIRGVAVHVLEGPAEPLVIPVIPAEGGVR